MRITRIIATVVAFALVALAPLALTSGASAADAGERAKPKHIGFATGKELGNTNRFIAYGKWTTYKGKKITVQRRACGGCQWKFYKKTKTTATQGQVPDPDRPGRTRLEGLLPRRGAGHQQVPPHEGSRRLHHHQLTDLPQRQPKGPAGTRGPSSSLLLLQMQRTVRRRRYAVGGFEADTAVRCGSPRQPSSDQIRRRSRCLRC